MYDKYLNLEVIWYRMKICEIILKFETVYLIIELCYF